MLGERRCQQQVGEQLLAGWLEVRVYACAWVAAGRREDVGDDWTLDGTPVSNVGDERLPAADHRRRRDASEGLDPRCDGNLGGLLTGGRPRGRRAHQHVFNGLGEPIVSSVGDTAACFRRLGRDFLILDDELLAGGPRWWREDG